MCTGVNNVVSVQSFINFNITSEEIKTSNNHEFPAQYSSQIAAVIGDRSGVIAWFIDANTCQHTEKVSVR